MDNLAHADAEILIVDDEPSVVRSLSRALGSAGYSAVKGFNDPVAVSAYLDSADPDLITLDMCMPGLDGYGLLESLAKRRSPDTFLPVLAISALDSFEAREKAVRAGAKDFLVKPIRVDELLLDVFSLLDTRFLERRLRESQRVLEGMVRERGSELGLAHLETIERLARVAELRDDATGKHTTRVARVSGLLAQELGLEPARHERWDGQGYPKGLAGEEIPLVARIVAVADAFDALTNVRPYKDAWSVKEAMAEMELESGTQFDPQVIGALWRVLHCEEAMAILLELPVSR